jgi:hypothetical protein
MAQLVFTTEKATLGRCERSAIVWIDSAPIPGEQAWPRRREADSRRSPHSSASQGARRL